MRCGDKQDVLNADGTWDFAAIKLLCAEPSPIPFREALTRQLYLFSRPRPILLHAYQSVTAITRPHRLKRVPLS